MADNIATRSTPAPAHSPIQGNTDTLTLSTLSLPQGLLAPYVFGPRRLQPATLSLSLELTHGVASAASRDALDQSTVHYGNLAKAVRDERRSEAETLKACVERVEGVVEGMAERRDGGWRVGRCGVEVLLGKASATGTGVRVGSEGVVGRDGREVRVRFEGCRVMVLIGVNAIERTARQRLEVDLEVRCAGREALGRDVEAFGLEREMVEIIEPTTFETLESLGEHVIKHLQPKIQAALPSCHGMSLTMRKPKAVAFAGAPVLTLTRVFRAESKETASQSGAGRLKLIKPYA